MKIALVHDFIADIGGAERVLVQLHSLFPEAPIYTAFADPTIVQHILPVADIRTSSLQNSILRKRNQYVVLRMPRAVEEYNLNEYDVVLSSSGAYSHGVITGPDTFHLCYCHSPMRYAWDWHSENLTERGLGNEGVRFIAEGLISKLRLWDSVSAQRVDQWIANSNTVAQRIKTYYRQPSEIIYPPVNTDFYAPELAQPYTTSRPYAISVSRLSKNKRIDLCISACTKAGIDLIIAGDGPDRSRLEYQAVGNNNITFVGKVSDNEARNLVAGAKCFVFASEDDFGIAPVEALSLGIPVIALGKGGATETVHDGHNGLQFAEPTVESMSTALTQYMSSGVSLNTEEIRATAQPFSSHTFQQKISQAVQHAYKH